MGTPAPAPSSAEQPWRLPAACPQPDWESGAKEEGSEGTEEACFLPGSHPLSSSWPSLESQGHRQPRGAQS